LGPVRRSGGRCGGKKAWGPLILYWLLFGYFAAGALLTNQLRSGDQQRPLLFLIGSALIAVAVGLRREVGGDWETYDFLFSYAGYADIDRVLAISDPAYQLLNWVMRKISDHIWTVNIVCGSIFAWGLYRFTQAHPERWLCFVVAVPYLVIVVAMGYTRQSVAIGIILAGLAAVERGASVVRFAIYVAAAALFHKTAVVVLPLVIFAGQRSNLLNVLAGIAVSILLYDLFLSESVEGFVRNYIDTEYNSQGAVIRVAMNFIPAAGFFLFRRGLRFPPNEERIWFFFSAAAVLMPALLFLVPSSTAIDRLALYLIPIQIAVLPRMRYLFKNAGVGKAAIVFYAGLVQFTWLNFAVYARYWVPYRSFIGA